jgi:hypothetical protein
MPSASSVALQGMKVGLISLLRHVPQRLLGVIGSGIADLLGLCLQ